MLKKGLFLSGIVAIGLRCNAAPDVPANPTPPNAPDFGPVVTQAVPPPPISGGTMLLSNDGVTAIVSDPDRDFVSFVDLDAAVVRAKTTLKPNDEPGRVAEDNAGNVYVALRGTGELATFSLKTGELLGRRYACNEPRGVAYDPARDQVLVACATGEFVTFGSGMGVMVSSVQVERDLRDVVVVGDRFYVSKFRQAEILQLDLAHKIFRRMPLPNPFSNNSHVAMAWRMRAATPQPQRAVDASAPPPPYNPDLVVSYQIDSTAFVPTTVAGGYGSGGDGESPNGAPQVPGNGGGIVHSVMARVPTGPSSMELNQPVVFESAVLPVDFAVSPKGDRAVLVAAGNIRSNSVEALGMVNLGTGMMASSLKTNSPLFKDQLIAAEMRNNGDVIVQAREPAKLTIVAAGTARPSKSITLSDISRDDTGHDIFHASSGTGIACASCHGEGGDDAQTWNFDGTKPRRTASLRGTVKGTAPYHWDADFADLSSLTHEVYTRRMGGRVLDPALGVALKGWLEQVPAPRRPPVDEATRVRGKNLFDGKADCTSCHSGPSYTNNLTVDVGTGKSMQVPPLVGVGARLPVMHDGCAKTLTDRFTNCTNSLHGKTAGLTANEVNDLVTYLDSL